MKTKLLILLFAIVASMETMWAAYVTIGGIEYYLIETELIAEVRRNTDCSGDVVIPDSVTCDEKTYSVTCIRDDAFRACESLTSVTIGNSVTTIGNYAFAYCSQLQSVTIGKSVTSIGDCAFHHCFSLTAIEIPNSVISIGDYAFCLNKSLTSVAIPNSVTSIGADAFSDCTSLTSVNIPNSVASIGGYAFSDCKSLTSITIPNSVTSIEAGAFYSSGLTSIIIPNSITSIENRVFAYCYQLQSVTIGNNVTSIGESAFNGCYRLSSITIPSSVTNIGRAAFSDCYGLISVTCLATTPPELLKSWSHVEEKSLYVPAESIGAYKTAGLWKDFGSILPISAKDTVTMGVQTASTENSVDIVWLAIIGAASYEIIIKDAVENTICTLVFNAKGQLVSVVFHASARNNAPQHQQEAGFVFTITGLDPGKEYTYTVTATNNSGDVLRSESGCFSTISTATDIKDIQNSKLQSTKILKNDQFLIRRGDKTYIVSGQMVKSGE